MRRLRRKKVCNVDKANVLETSQVWRDTVIRVSAEYPDIELSHMYVDNAAMQLVWAPVSFDVIVTGNMFGDILSDETAMLSGSIGMLASAALDANGKGLFEPALPAKCPYQRIEDLHGTTCFEPFPADPFARNWQLTIWSNRIAFFS